VGQETAGPAPAGEKVGTTRLGALEVSRMGLGGMVLTRSFGQPDQEEAIATFYLALELGLTLIDTADSYADGENEAFIGGLIATRRDQVVLSTKFGLVVDSAGGVEIDGRPEYVKAACDRSLRRLGVDYLDLYYQHRVDPKVPITETVGAMGELVAEGKVRHLGLCEVSADQLRTAHAVHLITAVESEWSLWARQIEADVLPAARELGIGIVPYSPLGRGFLAGAIRSEEVIGSDDLRGPDPRLHGDNLRRNLMLVESLEKLGSDKGATLAQLALAWLVNQGDDVVPIPGVERRDLLRQNVNAFGVQMTPEDLSYLDQTFAPGIASGNPDATLLRGGSSVDPEGENK
jgi:aryl-alcohol dehydrogenase-like predicted oxidoreductase